MIKKYWKLILIFVLVLLAAGGYYQFYYQSETTAQQNTISQDNIIEVKKGNIQKTIAVEGYIKAVKEENMAFPVKTSGSTKIKKINVNEGDKVEKSELLMALDKSEARLNYIQKQNAYNKAQINGSQTQIKEAEIELEMAQNNLENMELKAPFSGIITEINVEEGDYYTSGDVLTLKDISQLEVEVNIGETSIPEIKKGQKAEVNIQSLPGKKITGRVTDIESEATISSGTVTVPVIVTLDKIEEEVKLNSSAKLDIIVGEVQDKIVLPITALVNRQGEEYVIKYEEGNTSPVKVKTGLSNGLKIAIESGIKPGDKVVLNNATTSFGRNNAGNQQNSGSRPRPGGGRP